MHQRYDIFLVYICFIYFGLATPFLEVIVTSSVLYAAPALTMTAHLIISGWGPLSPGSDTFHPTHRGAAADASTRSFRFI